MPSTSSGSGTLAKFFQAFEWLWKPLSGVIGFFSTGAVVAADALPESHGARLDLPVAAVLAFTASLLTYTYWKNSPQYRHDRRLVLFFVTSAAVLIAYLVLFAAFTETDNTGERYVKGWRYTPEVVEYKRLSAGGLDEMVSDRSLVNSYGNDPANVWEGWTITCNRLLLHGLLIVLSVPVTLFTSTLVMRLGLHKKA